MQEGRFREDLYFRLNVFPLHARQNQYNAIIRVEPVDGSWKITNLDLLEEKRIDPYAPPSQS